MKRLPHPDWDGILADDEYLIWQGGPKRNFWRELRLSALVLCGAGFIAGSLYWLSGKTQDYISNVAGLLMPFVLLLAIWASATLWKERSKRRTTYTLTNKRAFLGKVTLHGSYFLDQYPIIPESYVELKQGDPPSIAFAYPAKPDDLLRHGVGKPIVEHGLEFAHLEDGIEVYKLILRARNEAATNRVSQAKVSR